MIFPRPIALVLSLALALALIAPASAQTDTQSEIDAAYTKMLEERRAQDITFGNDADIGL